MDLDDGVEGSDLAWRDRDPGLPAPHDAGPLVWVPLPADGTGQLLHTVAISHEKIAQTYEAEHRHPEAAIAAADMPPRRRASDLGGRA